MSAARESTPAASAPTCTCRRVGLRCNDRSDYPPWSGGTSRSLDVPIQLDLADSTAAAALGGVELLTRLVDDSDGDVARVTVEFTVGQPVAVLAPLLGSS